MAGTVLKNPALDLHRFRARLALAGLFLTLLLGLLGARFYFLQVLQHSHYRTLAENNRITIVPVVPNRGLIRDRNGVILAQNFSAYTLEITPGKVDDLKATVDQLARWVEITPKDRKRFQKLVAENHEFESLPLRTRLTDLEVARLSVQLFRFPGAEIKARLYRHYPHGELTSHIVGYIGRINERDLEDFEARGVLSNYRGSDHVGKLGIEQGYEAQLHGVTGFVEVETDAGGRAVRTLARRAPVSGMNLVLSLDLGLQEVATQALGDYRGSLVAIEPASGEILAFVSKPGFDPNLFVDGIDVENWKALNESLDRPMVNRGLRGVYPPGSTFKPFMALAGLELGARTPRASVFDPGFYQLGGRGRRYRCWRHGGHGTVDLHKSVVVSCDTYYYSLANDLGIDRLHDFVTRFGFGEKTGVDIAGESAGLLPSRAWKRKRFKQRWYPGETVITGIGQGYTLATPLQLAAATAALADGGRLRTPRLVVGLQDARTGLVERMPGEARRALGLHPGHLRTVVNAMVGVTRPGGTAYQATRGAPYAVAGKTGTAQVVGIGQNERYDEKRTKERHRDHALYVAFAPADDPKIALAIVVENGGHGGSTAAPMARAVLDYFLLGKKPDPAGIREEAAGD